MLMYDAAGQELPTPWGLIGLSLRLCNIGQEK